MIQLILFIILSVSDSTFIVKDYAFRNDTLFINCWSAISEENLRHYLDIIDNVNPKVIYLRINSYGGEPFSAKNFAKTLSLMNVEVITESHGIVSSAGFILYLTGRKRIASSHTLFFIHCIQTLTLGFLNPVDLDKRTRNLTKIQKEFNEFISEKLDIPVEVVDSLSRNETWLNGREAMKFNIVTELKEE